MSNHYLDCDSSGSPVQTPKGRGPTKKGYVESSPGVWTKDKNYVAPVGSATKYDKQRQYVYARFEKGVVVERKPVTKGRPPAGFVRCEVQDGSIVPLQPQNIEQKVQGSKKNRTSIVSDRRYTVEDVRKFIRFVSIENNPNKISFVGCDISEKMPVQFLAQNTAHSRIDFDLNNGDILIWRHEYTPDEPDVVISQALVSTRS